LAPTISIFSPLQFASKLPTKCQAEIEAPEAVVNVVVTRVVDEVEAEVLIDEMARGSEAGEAGEAEHEAEGLR
jgi:hypothetical protein